MTTFALPDLEPAMTETKRERVDPRDPDPSRSGIFRDHNCYRCRDGELPCIAGNLRQCDYPHARND